MRGSEQSRPSKARREAAKTRHRRSLVAAIALGALTFATTPCMAGPAATKPMLGAMRPVTALGASIGTSAPTMREADAPRRLENVGKDRVGFEILQSVYAVVGMTGNSLANLATRPPAERVLIGFKWIVRF